MEESVKSKSSSPPNRRNETQERDDAQLKTALQELSVDPSRSRNGEALPVKNKVGRGLSLVNSDIVSRARSLVEERDVLDSSGNEYIDESPNYTFVLPNLSQFSNDFAEFLRKDLVETSSLVSLENAGFLNWWAEKGSCQRLWPLVTSGDGNCLLHAASLGMWGFHDRLLTLRKAMHRVLLSDLTRNKIRRRWQWQLWLRNLDIGGLVYSEKEWETEWNEVLRIASADPRPKPTPPDTSDSTNSRAKAVPLDSIPENELTDSDANFSPEAAGSGGYRNRTVSFDNPPRYESLEEIHIFVLAHVLRRPIVVVSDTMLRGFDGEAIAPIPFGGVYLPMECPHDKCYKNPLVLVFDSAHFSALVPMEMSDSKEKLVAAIPLVAADYELLPLHFAADPGVEFEYGKQENYAEFIKEVELDTHEKLELLHKYLDILYIPPPGNSSLLEQFESQIVLDKTALDKTALDNTIPDKLVKDSVNSEEYPKPESGTQSPKKEKKKALNKYIDKCKDFIVPSKDEDGKHKSEKKNSKENVYDNNDHSRSGSRRGSMDSTASDSSTLASFSKDKKSDDKKDGESKWFGSLKMRRPSLTREKAYEVTEEPKKDKSEEPKKDKTEEPKKDKTVQDDGIQSSKEELSKKLSSGSNDSSSSSKDLGIRFSLQSGLLDIGKVVSAVASTSQLEQSSILSARLSTDKKPVYYKEMIDNYIASAKVKYEKAEKDKRSKPVQEQILENVQPTPCINPGCNLYGTHVTNYLCTACHKVQKRIQMDTASKVPNPPPYEAPPPYSSVSKHSVQDSVRTSSSTEHDSVVHNNTQPCMASECTFYGTKATQGYCSSCFKKHKKSLAYMSSQR